MSGSRSTAEPRRWPRLCPTNDLTIGRPRRILVNEPRSTEHRESNPGGEPSIPVIARAGGGIPDRQRGRACGS
jgi:hypothetical protein